MSEIILKEFAAAENPNWKVGPPPTHSPSIGWLLMRFQNRLLLQPYKVAFYDEINDFAIFSVENGKWVRWGTIFHDTMVSHCPTPFPGPIPGDLPKSKSEKPSPLKNKGE